MMDRPPLSPSVRAVSAHLFLHPMRSDLLNQGGVNV